MPKNTILFNAQAPSSAELNSDLKTDGTQATETKKDKNRTTCTGFFVSRGADSCADSLTYYITQYHQMRTCR